MASSVALIGRLPGYNKNIDDNGFTENLRKGITYIDMYPSSYVANAEFSNINGGKIPASLDELNKAFGTAVGNLFTKPGLFALSPPAADPISSKSDPSGALFKNMLTRMKTAFALSGDFDSKEAIRIIAANDSTFTETFTNTFDKENPVVEQYNRLKGNATRVLGVFQKGAQALSHAGMMNLIGSVSQGLKTGNVGATFDELMTGAMFGLNIAAPIQWTNSEYNSVLNLFVKLVSPTGEAECIRRNILEPLLYLVAAASPITTYGIVYGYPLLWQVQAQGITSFRLGGIAALTFTRGSFETTFNMELQPTIVDVRLTIIPLLKDFAAQTLLSGDVDSIYKQPQYLGVQNPADIYRGTMNTKPVGSNQAETKKIKTIKL